MVVMKMLLMVGDHQPVGVEEAVGEVLEIEIVVVDRFEMMIEEEAVEVKAKLVHVF